jgi:DNA-binding beta-propeller fold protein YncE
VADQANNRIQKFDSEGNFLIKWGAEGSEDGQFDFPNGIAVDSSGRVYVVEYGNNRIQVFDSKGNFLAKWGKYGAGDMELAWPSYGIAISQSGDVYVSDTFNNRIKVFRSPVGGPVYPANNQTVS